MLASMAWCVKAEGDVNPALTVGKGLHSASLLYFHACLALTKLTLC